MTTPLNIVDVEKMEVLPSNQPNNNTYSFKNGNPIITLEIASQNKLLRPSSLRINGKLTVKNSNGYIAQNNSIVQNTNGRGGDAGSPAGAVDIKLNPRVGVNSVIQNLVISSNQTNQSLESVRQYGRMCASILSGTHSQDDFMSHRSVVALNPALQTVGANLNNNTVDFSMRLYAGMFMGGNAIPLGVNGVRGLTLNIELASDQMVLAGADAPSNTGAFYELSDITLTADLLIPDAEGQQKLGVAGNGAFQYNSFNSLYSVINASDATQTYNLAQNNVLNVFHNFLPVSHANNYTQDSFTTDMLKNTDATGATYNADVQLNKVSFSRGGLKLGLDYDLDVQKQSAEGRPETGVLINGLNALKPFYKLTKTLNSKQLIGYGGNDLKPYSATQVQQVSEADVGARNFLVGLALDNVSGVGMSFRGQAYATRIQSTLDGKSPNSVYTYVLAKNTLMYSPQGIMVQA
jgi:hypothetical protein